MDYKVRHVETAGAYQAQNRGYDLYEDDRFYFSVFIKNGKPDPTSWATINSHCERDMPIFTEEYCKHQGITRKEYDTITIID